MTDKEPESSWALMNAEEIHAFGIDAILLYVQKEGVTIQAVNRDPAKDTQIIGERWGSAAVIYVRTALYPGKGEQTQEEFFLGLKWATEHQATAFFASVGLACINYPDRSPVTNEEDMKLAIRYAGYAVAFEGLLVMTTSDRVSELDIQDQK